MIYSAPHHCCCDFLFGDGICDLGPSVNVDACMTMVKTVLSFYYITLPDLCQTLAKLEMTSVMAVTTFTWNVGWTVETVITVMSLTQNG